MNKSYQPTTQVETDKRLSSGKVMKMIEAPFQVKIQSEDHWIEWSDTQQELITLPNSNTETESRLKNDLRLPTTDMN